eukprot:Skav234144  [mRNA]  locus=scaffold361:128816:130254:+ [translate_table: standard]
MLFQLFFKEQGNVQHTKELPSLLRSGNKAITRSFNQWMDNGLQLLQPLCVGLSHDKFGERRSVHATFL